MECFKGHLRPISGFLGFLQIELYDCPVWKQGVSKIFAAKEIQLQVRKIICVLLWYSQAFEKSLEISKFFRSSTPYSSFEAVCEWSKCS